MKKSRIRKKHWIILIDKYVWKNTCMTVDKGLIAILCQKFSQIANKKAKN